MKAIIYARVSTDRQDVSRQIQDLRAVAAREGYEVVREFSETVTGASKFAGRRESEELVDYVTTEKIRCIFVTEISRLGRSTIDVQQTVEKLVTELRCNIYIGQMHMFLLNDKGEFLTVAKIIMDLMAGFAQMERDVLRERIKSGITEAKRKGVKLGRPQGSTTDAAFLKRHHDIVVLLNQSFSISKTAATLKCSPTTVKKVRRLMSEKPELPL